MLGFHLLRSLFGRSRRRRASRRARKRENTRSHTLKRAVSGYTLLKDKKDELRRRIDWTKRYLNPLDDRKDRYIHFGYDDLRTVPKEFRRAWSRKDKFGRAAKVIIERDIDAYNQDSWLDSVNYFNTLRRVYGDTRATVVCIRRRMRRRALFALDKAGHKGQGAKSDARWNEDSTIHCRRK